MSSGSSMASLHSGLIHRARGDDQLRSWEQTQEEKSKNQSLKEFFSGKSEELPSSMSWLSRKREARETAPQETEARDARLPNTAEKPSFSLPPKPVARSFAPPAPSAPSTAEPDRSQQPVAEKPAQAELPSREEVEQQAEAPVQIPAVPPVLEPVNKPRPFARPKSTGTKTEPKGRRVAMTLRLDEDQYHRLANAKDQTGRTAQDIMDTALGIYLKLIDVDEK